ncbi:MAG TPA: DUF3298 and DUF4163 domain-containing protein [Mobilitalea sp.]|nr:DUF3298 and DUF4163 domain-containing protein [Mobilitalea sp.]
MEEYSVIVKEMTIKQDMYYKDQIILKYTINYPKFISETFQTMVSKLNTLYETKALMYEKSNIQHLYQMAMVEYEYSVANNFPIRQFEAYVTFDVTYDQNCAVSLYFDQYEYAGGAHGLTYRYSDTWDLQRSKRISLHELFPDKTNDKENIIQSINQQIASDIVGGNNMYFDNYSDLVNENFKPNNFYLTKKGVNIYFQQYDIAPYAAGLPTFLIPYALQGPIPPSCV